MSGARRQPAKKNRTACSRVLSECSRATRRAHPDGCVYACRAWPHALDSLPPSPPPARPPFSTRCTAPASENTPSSSLSLCPSCLVVEASAASALTTTNRLPSPPYSVPPTTSSSSSSSQHRPASVVRPFRPLSLRCALVPDTYAGFGQPAPPATGGFGAAANPSAGGGLFGAANTSTAGTGFGFGQAAQQPAAGATGGGLFGAAPKPAGTGFGGFGANTSTPAAGGLGGFGKCPPPHFPLLFDDSHYSFLFCALQALRNPRRMHSAQALPHLERSRLGRVCSEALLRLPEALVR